LRRTARRPVRHHLGPARFTRLAALETNPVPEPETYMLTLAGLAVLGAAARRKARHN